MITRRIEHLSDPIQQNGMVPLGVLLNDSTIQAQTQQFLDYILDHQDSTGWLGPEVNTTKPRYLWGRCVDNATWFYFSIWHDSCASYPFFFGAIQMVEANPSLAVRVVPALHKFVSLANAMLHNGQGLEDWTNTRWEDFVITLQWWGIVRRDHSWRLTIPCRLYDFHPDGQETILIDTMKMLKWTGDPWEQVFSPAVRSHWFLIHMNSILTAIEAFPTNCCGAFEESFPCFDLARCQHGGRPQSTAIHISFHSQSIR